MDSKHVNIQMEPMVQTISSEKRKSANSKASIANIKAKHLSEKEKQEEKSRILKVTLGYISLFVIVLSVISVILYFKLYEYPTITSRNGNGN